MTSDFLPAKKILIAGGRLRRFARCTAPRSAPREERRHHCGSRRPTDSRLSHTFDVPGAYTYFCIPHEMLGMVATITAAP